MNSRLTIQRLTCAELYVAARVALPSLAAAVAIVVVSLPPQGLEHILIPSLTASKRPEESPSLSLDSPLPLVICKVTWRQVRFPCWPCGGWAYDDDGNGGGEGWKRYSDSFRLLNRLVYHLPFMSSWSII